MKTTHPLPSSKSCKLLVLLLLAACGPGVDAPANKLQACADLGVSWCERRDDCEPPYPGSQTACVNDYVWRCCGDHGTCDEPIGADLRPEDWRDCLDGFADLSCNDLTSDVLPIACLEAL